MNDFLADFPTPGRIDTSERLLQIMQDGGLLQTTAIYDGAMIGALVLHHAGIDLVPNAVLLVYLREATYTLKSQVHVQMHDVEVSIYQHDEQ